MMTTTFQYESPLFSDWSAAARYLRNYDGRAMVELFDGAVFDVHATTGQVIQVLLELVNTGGCMMTRTEDQYAVYLTVAEPDHGAFVLVFDKDTEGLISIIDLADGVGIKN